MPIEAKAAKMAMINMSYLTTFTMLLTTVADTLFMRTLLMALSRRA